MTLQEFKENLITLEVPVYHILAAPEEACPCLCWQELEGTTLSGDNLPIRLAQIQLDYFTEEEYDTAPDAIEEAVFTMDCSMVKNAFSYDESRSEWRTTWTVEFVEARANG